MKRQALTLAAAAVLTLGLAGYSHADDATNAQQNPNSGAAGQTGSETRAGQNGSQTSSASETNQQGQQGATANAANANTAEQGGQGNFRQELQAANDPDKLFVVMSAVDNQCEIQLGQLAQQKAQDEDVKKIAQKIVEDHQKAQQQLQTVAQQLGIQIPQSTPMTKQQEMTVFQSLNGKQFDQQYISHLRAAHAKCISETSDEAQIAQNDQVKQYAQQQLPILQEHEQRLEKCAVALGLPNTAEAQTAGERIGGNNPEAPSNSNSNSGK